MATGPAAPARSHARGSGGRASATVLLSLGSAVVFAWCWWASGFPILDDGGRLEPLLLRDAGALDWLEVREEGAWWRLFSAVLLHGSWWHLAFNLWALFVLGSAVERGHGRTRWALVVSLSAVGSGLAALAWGSANLVVGISGVVFGLGGYLVAEDLNARIARYEISREPSTRGSISPSSNSTDNTTTVRSGELAFWLGATIAIGFVWPELSQAGHLGGLVTGVVSAGLGRHWKWAVASGLALIGGGAIAIGTTVDDPQTPDGWERLGYALLDAERPADAWPAFDQALEGLDEADDKRAEWQNAAAYARAIGSDERDEWARGLELVGSSLESDPENPNRLDTLGWLQCRLGDVESGRATLLRAADLMPDGPSEEVAEHLEACVLR